MEITAENFNQHFQLIKESINQADFIAIDSEFSGIVAFTINLICSLGHSVTLDDRGHEYDTVEERYQKLRYVC